MGFFGGRGGDAYAEADGEGSVSATARGGDGGGAAAPGFGGIGGNANAIANAIAPTGGASSFAIAQVGVGASGARNGRATASSRAAGVGNLTSRTLVDADEGRLTSTSQISVNAGEVSRAARIHAETNAPAVASALVDSGNVQIQSAIRPTNDSVRARLDAGNFRLRQDLDLGGTSEVFAHASYASSAPAVLGNGTFESYMLLQIRLDANGLASPQNLVVGLLDPIFSGDAAGSVLNIRVSRPFSLPYMFDATLTPGAFVSAFDDRTLDFGDIMQVANDRGDFHLNVELRFTTTDPNARVALDFLVANTTLGSGLPIPEPSAALLMVLGLLGLGSKRPRPAHGRLRRKSRQHPERRGRCIR
ncbi:MAG: PEP-CTERM sorting domain-containing protein [Myxococcota bacterium]